MFGGHFYHASIRRTIAAFGSIFNDIKILRVDGDGEVKNITRVPLAYGPRQKFLARLADTGSFKDTVNVAMKLPRMSFQIGTITYDAAAQVNKMNQVRYGTITNGKQNAVYTHTPYKMSIELNIMAKNQDDALQILEQILPYFQPDYTITIKEVPAIGLKTDVPVVLSGVTMTDEYEGNFVDRRVIIYTLSFDLRVRFYGPVREKQVILTSSVDVNSLDTFGFLEEVTAEGNPVNLTSETGTDTTDDNLIT
jgi:hypothetical protein